MGSSSDNIGRSGMPFQAADPPLTRTAIQKLRPDLDDRIINPLAQIWDEVVHRIIGEMLVGESDGQGPLHVNIREGMIWELAKLQLWLGDLVVAKRLGERSLATIDLARERDECLGPDGVGAIAATAKMAYEHIWAKRMMERWKPKSAKAIERDANPRRTTLAIKPVSKKHFIPLWYIRDNWVRIPMKSARDSD